MRAPIIEGRIERRLLVNWRLEPELAASLVPAPFRPQVVNGYAVAGVCLIRLGDLRPMALPRRLGLTSENAAHRIAVEWDDEGGVHRGVFIPRRDTASVANTVIGGRLFPGVHHAVIEHARSSVFDDTSRFPSGSAVLDSALVMLDVPVSWHPIGSVRTAPSSDAQRAFDRRIPGEFAR